MQTHLLTPLLLLSLAATPATQPTTDFLVTGTVTDDAGQPVANATVVARCGSDNTRVNTGRTRTDKAGHYSLSFEPGVHFERTLGHPVIGFQSATITVSKPGYFEKDLCRRGDLAMTDDPPTTDHDAARNYAGVVRIHEPYTLDFVLSKAATVEGTLVDPAGRPLPKVSLSLTGPKLPPTLATLATTSTNAAGHFRFNNVPTGYEWSFQNRDRGYDQSNLSAPFTLGTPDATTFTVTADSEKHTLSYTLAADVNPTQ